MNEMIITTIEVDEVGAITTKVFRAEYEGQVTVSLLEDTDEHEYIDERCDTVTVAVNRVVDGPTKLHS
jgi:hypothetical protein